METVNEIHMAASPNEVFRLAAEVDRWPELLPHYRWVRQLEGEEERKVVEMAARRDWIPVRWVSVQRLFPSEHRITFEHIGGVTRGMRVEWTITPLHDGSHVRIWHDFRPGWPLVPDSLVELVVGRFFVGNIAGKTLRRIKALAESKVEGPESRVEVQGGQPARGT